jgi:hypothetical protein
VDHTRTLTWMRHNGAVLRALVAEENEAAGAGNDAPAGDPAIRAHLRLLAAALEQTADENWQPRLADLQAGVAGWFADSDDLFDHHLAVGEGAMALEAHLQWGTVPGADPSLDVAQERRLRLLGWVRIFLLGLERHLGPSADGFSPAALGWMDGRQRDLGRSIAALDAQAKAAAARSAGDDLDAELIDQIGQAILVQAYTRHVAEAACAVMNEIAAQGADTA